MEEQFKILFSGQLRPGVTPEEAIKGFTAQFGINEDKAQALINSGREVVVKQGLARQQAEKQCIALAALGLIVSLAPMEPPPTQPASSLSVESEELQEPAPEAAANPYAAPTADLMPETEANGMSGPAGVPASHGWAWLMGSFWHFKRNPWAWIGAIVIFILLSVALQVIPLIGGLLLAIFHPVIIAGFMLGTQEQDLDRDFRVGHLFAGFSNRNLGQLVLVGLLYLAGFILIVLGIGLMVGGALTAMGGLQGDPEMMANVAMSPTILIAVLVGLALIIPLMMAYWFAPALVVLDDISAMNAMKLSFFGCLNNILPFLIYGLAGMLLMIVGMIPLFLGLLVVIPMITASIYVAYRDIFYD